MQPWCSPQTYSCVPISLPRSQALLPLQGVAIDKTLTRPGDWVATGVTTDADVRPGARIMVASVLLYGFVQVI